jgi:8-oxo-dGTP pyrophosphatase MutT (NUDIX family)
VEFEIEQFSGKSKRRRRLAGRRSLPNKAGSEVPVVPVRVDGASVILLRRDAVLMVRRGAGLFAGLWSFPGGRIEVGEDAETAARRELYEETRLIAGPLRPLGPFQPAHLLSPLAIMVFAGRAGAAQPQAGDDARQAEFVPLEGVLTRPCTPKAAAWIARAIVALATAS